MITGWGMTAGTPAAPAGLAAPADPAALADPVALADPAELAGPEELAAGPVMTAGPEGRPSGATAAGGWPRLTVLPTASQPARPRAALVSPPPPLAQVAGRVIADRVQDPFAPAHQAAGAPLALPTAISRPRVRANP